MPTVLGKRKKTAPATTADPADAAAAQDVFRRHFEAQFKPLDVATSNKTRAKPKPAARAGDDNDSDAASSGGSSGWSGLSDDDDDDDETAAAAAEATVVEVVDYSGAGAAADTAATTTMTKRERKLYLSSRPPSTFLTDDDDANTARRKGKHAARDGGGGDDPDDAQPPQYKDAPDLLANDLALQRLLAESHLLAGAFSLPSSLSAAAAAAAAGVSSSLSTHGGGGGRPFAAGRLRQRTTDLRIQAVAHQARTAGGGSSSNSHLLLPGHRPKDSIFTQASMPMAQRKGIAAAAATREARRRREARESGIVLERPTTTATGAGTSKQAMTGKRLRAVDAPAVGRLKGSELRLGKRDIRAIEGPARNAGPEKKKKRR